MSLFCDGYNKVDLHRFWTETEKIAEGAERDDIQSSVNRLNEAYFAGGALAPQSFEQLTSSITTNADAELSENHFIVFIDPNVKDDTLRYKFSYLEGIPGIGSAIAVFKTLFHLFGLIVFKHEIKHAAKELGSIPSNEATAEEITAYHVRSNKVFSYAMEYTSHYNGLMKSLLAIIPFVKPLFCLHQIYSDTKHLPHL
ncbi:MAG: hypothetical protein H0X51_08080 [Parachlamydiaceae bacterium]|nr:hypothetical protein [Parachlamydiaceae bacterium]